MIYGGFSEYALPREITLGPSSTVSIAVDRVAAISGKEEFRKIWSTPRREFEVLYGPRESTRIDEIFDAWMVHDLTIGFRIRDHTDYKSSQGDEIAATDQTLIADLSVHDGSTDIALYKRRALVGRVIKRRIRKPVHRGFVVAVDGVETSNFTLDAARGIVSFPANPATLFPGATTITWGGMFDVPVRFADSLGVSATSRGVAETQSVILRECFDDEDLTPATEADEAQAALGPSTKEFCASIMLTERLTAAVNTYPGLL